MIIKHLLSIFFILSFSINVLAGNIEEANSELQKNNTSKAEEFLKKEIKNNPDSLEAHEMLEKIYFENFQLEKMLSERTIIRNLKNKLNEKTQSNNTSIEKASEETVNETQNFTNETKNKTPTTITKPKQVKIKLDEPTYNLEKIKIFKLSNRIKLAITDTVDSSASSSSYGNMTNIGFNYSNLAKSFTDYLTSYLLEANVEVIEMKRMIDILQTLDSSRFIEKKQLSNFSKLTGSDYLLSCDIQQMREYNINNTQNNSNAYNNNNSSVSQIKAFFFKVSIKLVHIQTGKLILSEVLTEKIDMNKKIKSTVQEYEIQDKILQRLVTTVVNKCVIKLSSLV